MAGLRNLPSAAEGFMQGFSFMEGIDRGREADERAAAHEEREVEFHEERMAGLKTEREHLDRERKNAETVRLGQALLHSFNSGEPDPVLLRDFADSADIDLARMLTPQYGTALDILRKVPTGETDLRSKEALAAANLVLAPRIQKGIGTKTRKGDVITRKALQAIYPTEDGKGLMLDLAVWAQGEDGEEYRYDAPVTPNRSADDEDVLVLPIESMLDNLQGQSLLHKLVGAEQMKPIVEAAILRHGGGIKPPEGEEDFTLGEGQVRYAADGSVIAENPKDEAGGGGTVPADIQLMNRLLKAGIAADEDEAWYLARMARYNPMEMADTYVTKSLERQTEMGIEPGDEDYRSPAQLRKEAVEYVGEMEQALREDRRKRRGEQGAAPAASPGLQPPAKPATPAAKPAAAPAVELPEQARAQLKEGFETRFGNGQVWTLENGEPKRLR